jgi:hypothetical protein
MECILKQVSQALTRVLSVWNLHVIVLSKVTPRYVTLFTKGKSRPLTVESTQDL